jgi:hypothetical protein
MTVTLVVFTGLTALTWSQSSTVVRAVVVDDEASIGADCTGPTASNNAAKIRRESRFIYYDYLFWNIAKRKGAERDSSLSIGKYNKLIIFVKQKAAEA